jgi:hypothetical protein
VGGLDHHGFFANKTNSIWQEFHGGCLGVLRLLPFENGSASCECWIGKKNHYKESRTMSILERNRAVLVIALGLSCMTAPALAQKSGGTSSSTGGGGGGGSKVTTTTVIVPLVGAYYGIGGSGSTVAKGTATMVFDATQTVRSITVDISSVNLPDGSIVHAEMYSNGYVIPTSYYPIMGQQSIADLSLSAGASSMTLSTANGDLVPLFGTAGTIYVNVYDFSGTLVGRVASGSFNTLVKGGKPKLGP